MEPSTQHFTCIPQSQGPRSAQSEDFLGCECIEDDAPDGNLLSDLRFHEKIFHVQLYGFFFSVFPREEGSTTLRCICSG